MHRVDVGLRQKTPNPTYVNEFRSLDDERLVIVVCKCMFCNIRVNAKLYVTIRLDGDLFHACHAMRVWLNLHQTRNLLAIVYINIVTHGGAYI